MDFINREIQQYSEEYTTHESELLRFIDRETHAKVLMPRMLSCHLQGRLLAMISNLVRPKAVLEIGTYTGYSAICLAEGLVEGGTLYTIDINEELEERVKSYFSKTALGSKIDYRIGNALEIIPSLDVSFDIVFIDADKENYSKYFDLVINKVNLGGIILADNVLWSGKVLDTKKVDKDTQAIKDFNKKVFDDPRVESLLLPVRDGIMILRKVAN